MVTNNSCDYQPAQYNVQTGGASGTLNNVATGTTGQVLTAQGASAQPIWTSAGTFVLLSSQTASNSSSILFTTQLTSTYANYFLVVNNYYPINNGDDLTIQLSTNGGSSYISTNYLSGWNATAYNGTTFSNSTSTTILYLFTNVAASGFGTTANGVFYLFNMTNGGAPTVNGTLTQSSSGGGLYFAFLQGAQTVATNINAMKIVGVFGNISTGTFSLYGIKQ